MSISHLIVQILILDPTKLALFFLHSLLLLKDFQIREEFGANRILKGKQQNTAVFCIIPLIVQLLFGHSCLKRQLTAYEAILMQSQAGKANIMFSFDCLPD